MFQNSNRSAMDSLSSTSSSSLSTAAAAAVAANRVKKGGANSSSSKEGSAKAAAVDHISQAVQSTSNLLHLMQQSSPSQDQLMKLPKNLLARASTINNTAQVLEQMPKVISSLDAHIESGLHSVPHLRTVNQLLSNIESSQLSSAVLPQTREETEVAELRQTIS